MPARRLAEIYSSDVNFKNCCLTKGRHFKSACKEYGDKNMVAVKTPKKLSLTQIKDKAKYLGINPGTMKKDELIRAIQRAEGNNPCFGTAQGFCQYTNCCFMSDCVKPSR
jgi:hypothetical protein